MSTLPDSSEPFLRMENIRKTFPGVVANDNITLEVKQGEIHALLGENGAGKTTLMKILYGMYQPDSGTITLRGDRVQFESPKEAIKAGIGMVHQHFMLIPRLSVLENIILGRGESTIADSPSPVWKFTPLRKLAQLLTMDTVQPRQRIQELEDRYEMDIDPDTKVWQLGVGQRQQIEIIKALYQDVELLILDEPTAVLTPDKIEQLFDILRKLVSEGLTVIIITHKLDEIKQVSDRTTVLRDGTVIDTVETNAVTRSELAEMMVGREVLFDVDRSSTAIGQSVLTVSDLTADDDRGVEAVAGVDLDVRAGEIVGIAGVSGNGQSELAECLVGIRDITNGSITVGDQTLTGRSPRAFVEANVSFIPEDRMLYGAAMEMSVEENSIMKDIESFQDGVFLDHEKTRRYAERLVDEFDVRVPDVDVDAGKLSGGNLQKLILARELSRDPDVLIANQPTRGVDVGAIEYIQNTLLDQRDQGTGIVLISDKLDEVLQLSDRILVMYEGEIVYETTRQDADRDHIGRVMAGDTTESSQSPPT